MANYKLLSSRLTVVTSVLSCLILRWAGVWASTHIRASQSEGASDLKLYATNKTAALKVISVKKVESDLPMVEVTVQNQSPKNITSFMLAIGDLMILTDYVPDGTLFGPGEQNVQRISLGNFEAAAAKNPKQAGEVVVTAVYFDDRTGEGDARRVEMIRKRYEGIKEQIKLALPILRNALSSSEDADNVLLAAESQVKNLPTEANNSRLSPDYRDGRDVMKQSLGESIQKLKKKTAKPNHKAEIKELMEFYEQLLTKI